jgi:hypothetical protein
MGWPCGYRNGEGGDQESPYDPRNVVFLFHETSVSIL